MTFLPAHKVKWITVHYSATSVNSDVPIATIDRWHRDRGFRKVGYHVYIRRNRTVEYGRQIREDGWFEPGAHSRGENSESVSICYEGGLVPPDMETGKDTRTDWQREEMIRQIRRLSKLYPTAAIEGHRDMPGAATQCPGFDVAGWWGMVERDKFQRPPTKYQRPGGLAALVRGLLSFFRGGK